MTTTYDVLLDRTTIVSNADVDLLYPVGTSFSVITTILQRPGQGSVGIRVTNGPNSVWFSLGPKTGENVISPPVGMSYIAVEWRNTDSVVYLFCSVDGEMWELCPMPTDEEGVPMPFPVFPAPTQAGLFFDTDPSTVEEETVVFGSPRVLPGPIFVQMPDAMMYEIVSTVETAKAIGTIPATQPEPVSYSEEAIVHALVGAPFGDLEFDVGKSVGWLARFVDDIFVTDINRGDQRYWVVNWTKSFAHTYYKFSSINYFTEPDVYREGQVTDANKYSVTYPDLLVYDDNDWVVFLDAHEGLSTDTRSLPNDYLISPFKSFMYREIARANAASRDRIVLPFFVFLRHDHIQNVGQSYEFEGTKFMARQTAGVPYYLPYQGLTRMFKVSALKDPEFDWSLLDTPVAVIDPTVKLQLVSYAYAHWNFPDVPPGETAVPPLSAENDLGWKQRCIISEVLPITGLPVGSAIDPVGTWKDPEDFPDPVGLRGPWAFDVYSDQITDAEIPYPPPAVAAAVSGIRKPMYDLVFRMNVRDGVWYASGETGNTEVVWDDALEEFVPFVPPIVGGDLLVTSAVHVHTAGAVVLALPTTNLVVANAAHTVVSSNVVIGLGGPFTNLLVNSSFIAVTSQNVTLTGSGFVLLIVNNGAHVVLAPNLVLT